MDAVGPGDEETRSLESLDYIGEVSFGQLSAHVRWKPPVELW
ncbi:MAG TPA: hypothetical protein VHY18_10210 [Solirubrobacteraceae bacterium]|nr:hypothetical protein [Solirubrobacteraceae bacterium]